MMTEVNDHFNSYGRWHKDFRSEFEAVITLMHNKVRDLSAKTERDDEFDYFPENNLREIKEDYQALWNEITEDLAGIYGKISAVHDELASLQNNAKEYQQNKLTKGVNNGN
jgi:hypothetical protein